MVTPPPKFDSKSPWKTIRLPIGASCSALGRLEKPPLASQPFNQPTCRCQHLPGECDEWHWTLALRWPKTIQSNRGRDVCGLHFLSADLLLTTKWEGSLFKKGTNKNWFQKLFWVGVLLFEPYYTYMFLLVNMIGSLFSLKNGFKTYILFDEYEWAKVGLKHWMLYFRDFCPFLCDCPCPWENHKQDNTNSCNSLIIVHTWVVCDLYCA